MSFDQQKGAPLGSSPRKFGLVLFVLLWVASGIGAFAASAAPATPAGSAALAAPAAPSVAFARSASPAVLSSPAGSILLSRDEALSLAFPKCKVERSTAYLTAEQVKEVAKLSKLEFKSTVIYPYRATKNGKWVGTAYFDTHRVRSLRETVMVVVKPNCTIGRVEVLSFAEPKDYLPRKKWYDQFTDRKLDDDLNINRKIRGVTGATLTSTATTVCCRRVLALDAVLRKAEAKRIRDEKAKKRRVGTTPTSEV